LDSKASFGSRVNYFSSIYPCVPRD